jgi:predicted PurR-regulated permease PerM
MRHRFRARSLRPADGDHAASEEQRVLEFEPGELTRIFVAPPWLRDAGLVAWLIVGIVLVLIGAIWLRALTNTIVVPLIVAALIASVAGPAVDWMQRRGVPRAGGTALVLLAVVIAGVAIAVLVIGGITGQSGDISEHLKSATNKVAGGLKDLGVRDSTSDNAAGDASSSVNSAGKLLLHGVARGIEAFAGFAVFAAFTILSLFFLLKDGPKLGAWVERHSGLPPSVASTVMAQLARAMRGYFGGVTIIAAFTATLVGLTAIIVGVPLAGTIIVVTFLGGYIPYFGAWIAGAFAVLIALGTKGTDAAIVMAIVGLLANGALQQMVQPIAFGATLGIHPLAVLVLTIAGGCLFGMIGLVLAAPLASAITHISQELGRAREAAEAAAAEKVGVAHEPA